MLEQQVVVRTWREQIGSRLLYEYMKDASNLTKICIVSRYLLQLHARSAARPQCCCSWQQRFEAPRARPGAGTRHQKRHSTLGHAADCARDLHAANRTCCCEECHTTTLSKLYLIACVFSRFGKPVTNKDVMPIRWHRFKQKKSSKNFSE